MTDTQHLEARALSESDFEDLASSLIMLSKRIRALFGIALAENGYYNGQDHLMMCLAYETSVAVSELAKKLDVRPSTVSKMLDRLYERGLVVRLPDRGDSRKTLVRLTRDGVQAQRDIRSVWGEVGRSLTPKRQEEAVIVVKQISDLNQVLHSRLLRYR
jgi:DNA-binding MarR family transcriptional regulator